MLEGASHFAIRKHQDLPQGLIWIPEAGDVRVDHPGSTLIGAAGPRAVGRINKGMARAQARQVA